MLENRLYKRSNLWKLFSRKYKQTKTIEHLMIDSIDIQENDRILEIGIGNGTVFKNITEKLEKGSLKSIDPSKRKVRQISRANRKNMGKGELFHGYPENIPFADRTFNKVFSLHTVQSCTDIKLALREIYRVLQIDGRFYIHIDTNTSGKEKMYMQLLKDQHFRDLSVIRRDSCLCIVAVK
ncbi:class I SAM-dependent methyltransferase [Bacillus cabrialesii]|uniref:Methyltransferase domain-containing protein n=1 Tax=Bacillus cabrialesii subsp. tritici TaxID=2944916 RepID=A0ABT9DML4_9BACI|nr:methyltransferase domain-containing protein [Bacillus cabrialesii]MDO8225950.1 methyltransferase domain-containing protein [Bacillus cabrialesii subsp. tritici]